MLDRTGKKYGPWTGLHYIRTDLTCGKRSPVWLFRCECGETKEIPTKRLSRPPICSCRINKKRREPVHGKCGSRIYRIWSSMKTRCTCKSHASYARYGALGITICPEWLKFVNFLSDMGEPPTNIHSIDRVDNTKGYSKENCRWATPKEQANNRKTNRVIAFDGRSQSVSLWAEEKGLSKECISYRLNAGWDTEKALNSQSIRKAG